MLLDPLGENDVELPVLFSEHLTGDGQKMFEDASKLNWEGIISKRADAPYRSERNENWLKIKAVLKGKFPVVGFIKDPSGVAALYLGKQEGKDLVYMGKVGTGWSRTVSSQIRKQLDTVVSPKSKLTKTIKKPKATWVEPMFYADVEYRDSYRKGCCGLVRSRDRFGNRISKRAIGPLLCLSRFHRVQLVTEHTPQFCATVEIKCWDHQLSALQTTRYAVHDYPPMRVRSQLRNPAFVPWLCSE